MESFTLIAPSERTVVVFTFGRNGIRPTTPGNTFSFSVEALRYTPSGIRKISIGLAGIKVAAPKN
jgi:hypothetical protein